MVIDLTRRLAANPAEPVARPPGLCSPLATRCRRTTLPNAPPRARHLGSPRVTCAARQSAEQATQPTPASAEQATQPTPASAEQATQPTPTGTGGKRRGICLKPYGGWGRRVINRDAANPGGAW